MLEEFLDYYLNQRKGKKGYKIIGKLRLVLMMINLGLIVTFALLFNIRQEALYFVLLLLFLIFFFFLNKNINNSLSIYSKQAEKRVKEDIRYWLIKNKGFSKSSQYNELGNLLMDKAKEYKFSINFSALYVLFLPIWSGLVFQAIREEPNNLYGIFFVASILTVFFVYIGFSLRIFFSSLFDGKYEKVKFLATKLKEIAIEESIKEVK